MRPGFLTAATSIGPSSALPEAERRRLFILQYCNLLAVVTMAGFAVLYWATDAHTLALPALISLACVPFYLLSWGLNRSGFPLAAKTVFLLVMSGSIAFSTLFIVGPAPGLHFYLLLAAVLPLLLWPLDKPFWILVFMALSLAGFLAVQNRPADWPLVVEFPASWVPLYSGLAVVAAYGTAVAILAMLQRRSEDDGRERELLLHQFETLSNTDPLTGLHNRRSILQRLEEERSRSARTASSFALLLGDVDLFKAINDSCGHEAGDSVLTGLALLFRSALRDVDSVARWGGEEFLILLPGTSAEGALVVGKKLCKLVEEAEFTSRGQVLHCTMTFGVAVLPDPPVELNDLIRRADTALYEGKAHGRNQVVLAPSL